MEDQKLKQNQIEKLSRTQSIILHLLPEILVACSYLFARQPVTNKGYPSIIALILAYAFILVSFELGYLLYQGKKKTGRFALQRIINYQNPIPWWQYPVWAIMIVAVIGAIIHALTSGLLTYTGSVKAELDTQNKKEQLWI